MSKVKRERERSGRRLRKQYNNLFLKYGISDARSLKSYDKKKNALKFKFLYNEIKSHNFKKITILDIGCGSGNAIKYLKKLKNIKKYTGIECSDCFYNYLIKKYKKEKKINFINTLYNKNTKLKNKYDVIFAISSIQEKENLNWCSIKYLKIFLKKTKRHLKKNGILIFDFFNYDNVDFLEKHLNYYKEIDIKNYCKKYFSFCNLHYLYNKYEGLIVCKKKEII